MKVIKLGAQNQTETAAGIRNYWWQRALETERVGGEWIKRIKERGKMGSKKVGG